MAINLREIQLLGQPGNTNDGIEAICSILSSTSVPKRMLMLEFPGSNMDSNTYDICFLTIWNDRKTIIRGGFNWGEKSGGSGSGGVTTVVKLTHLFNIELYVKTIDYINFNSFVKCHFDYHILTKLFRFDDGDLVGENSYDSDSADFTWLKKHYDNYLPVLRYELKFIKILLSRESNISKLKTASVVFEIMLKDIYETKETGVSLIDKYVKGDKILFSTDNSESEGWFFLFRGAIMSLRNKYAHNMDEADDIEVNRVISLYDLLIKQIKTVKKVEKLL